jgi:hypothetical protein
VVPAGERAYQGNGTQNYLCTGKGTQTTSLCVSVDAFKGKGNLYLHLTWLKLWGQELNPQLYQISVKYLEVSLDIKVIFALHLENVTNKATHILWVCKCLIGQIGYYNLRCFVGYTPK